MTGAFKYLSPREFHKLSPARKERYLAALFQHLHPEHKPLQKAGQIARKPKSAGIRNGED
jgi:hypothetical protein